MRTRIIFCSRGTKGRATRVALRATATIAIILCLPFSSFAAGGLDIYIVRHGETMGNVTGDYSVTNQCTFSKKGLQQVDALPAKLAAYRFDAILVSPAWRTQRTIMPYLKANGLRAEICPEIEEVFCGIDGDENPARDVPLGDEIVLEDETVFHFRDASARRHFDPDHETEALTQLRRGLQLIQERYAGSGKTILLVSHGCSGGRMAELLLGLKPRGRFSPQNTAIIHIRQEDDGSSELLLLNDKPPTFFDRFILTDGSGPEVPGFINLAGMWKIRAGDADEGAWLETKVPGGWEKDALPDYDGIAWYQHAFEVPQAARAAWGKGDVVLVMGGIDDADETFLNGDKIGASGEFPPGQVSAYNVARRYVIPARLLQPTNILTIRVSDWMGGGGLWRAPVMLGPADEMPETN